MSPNFEQFLKISTPVLKDWSPNLTKISEKINIPVLKDWSPNLITKSLKNQHSSTQKLVTLLKNKNI